MKIKRDFFFSLIEESLFWLSILYSFVWLSIGSYYSFPNAEDLSVTYISRDKGILDGAIFLLQTFDGRYTTNLLHGLNPLVINWIEGYKLMPLLSFLLLTSSAYFLISSLIPNYSYKKIKASLLFSTIIFSCSPAVVNQFFWMISCFVYLYPWIFNFIWIGSFIRFCKTNQTKWLLISVIMMYLSFGLNEMFLIFNSFVIALIYFTSMYQLHLIDKKSVYVLISFALFSIIMFITCPGIILRFSSHEVDRISVSYFNIFYIATYNFYVFILELILKWQFSASIVLVYLLLSNYQLNIFLRFKKKHLFFLILTLLLVAYSMTYTYYLPMGIEFIPYRVYAAIVPIMFIVGFLVVHLFFSALKTDNYSFKITSLFMTVILFFNMILGENSMNNIKKDYVAGKLDKFKFEMNQQMIQIQNVKSKNICWKSVKIKEISSYPSSIFSPPFPTPNRETEFWNSAMEKYYGVDEIYLEGDTVRLIDAFQKKVF